MCHLHDVFVCPFLANTHYCEHCKLIYIIPFASVNTIDNVSSHINTFIIWDIFALLVHSKSLWPKHTRICIHGMRHEQEERNLNEEYCVMESIARLLYRAVRVRNEKKRSGNCIWYNVERIKQPTATHRASKDRTYNIKCTFTKFSYGYDYDLWCWLHENGYPNKHLFNTEHRHLVDCELKKKSEWLSFTYATNNNTKPMWK